MQVRAGQEPTICVQSVREANGIEDIKSLSAMIVQSEKFGTSLHVEGFEDAGGKEVRLARLSPVVRPSFPRNSRRL
jgi:hypothetical protein